MHILSELFIVLSVVWWLASWIGLSCLAGSLARKKGRSYSGFFWFSVIFSPLIGIILALITTANIQKMEEREIRLGIKKKCPACAEVVKIEAFVCKSCGFDKL